MGVDGIHPDCYSCVIRQARSVAAQAGLDYTGTQDLLDAALRQLLMARSSPLTVQHIVRAITDTAQKSAGQQGADVYESIKRKSHQIALSFVPEFRKAIQMADDPLELSLRVAAAGNIIDFGAKDHESLDLYAELGKTRNLMFGRYDYRAFRVALERAVQILYVCDNVGELDFDRLLIEEIHTLYPKAQVTAAFRHVPIINDATLKDAYDAGIDQVAAVISSGSVYPGTLLPECSPEFRELYQRADLILCKGQGNFETLLPAADARIFFLLRIKCDTMADRAGVAKGELVFMQGKQPGT